MVKLVPELKMYHGSSDLDLDLGTSIAPKSFKVYILLGVIFCILSINIDIAIILATTMRNLTNFRDQDRKKVSYAPQSHPTLWHPI